AHSPEQAEVEEAPARGALRCRASSDRCAPSDNRSEHAAASDRQLLVRSESRAASRSTNHRNKGAWQGQEDTKRRCLLRRAPQAQDIVGTRRRFLASSRSLRIVRAPCAFEASAISQGAARPRPAIAADVKEREAGKQQQVVRTTAAAMLARLRGSVRA